MRQTNSWTLRRTVDERFPRLRWRDLAGAAGIFAVFVLGAVGAQSGPSVRVDGGLIRGTLNDGGGAAFKGIAYAQPPVGELRWREPMPVRAWSGTRDATAFGAVCPQNPGAAIPNAVDLISEDCLFLNVWTSEWPVTSRRPVLVFIPGGGNINGAGSEGRNDGSHLARRGIVVVTMNYRLGSFGFFSHAALTAESPNRASGNQGLLDQIAALRWVRANIDRFGGDSDAITIAGISAGAVDVTALMTSPLTKNLFRQAVMQSGPARNVLGQPLPRAEAEQQGAAHTRTWGAAGEATLRDLRAIPMATILKSQPPRPVAHLNVSIDGHVVLSPPADVFAAGRQHAVPAIMGNGARDFTPGSQPPADLHAEIGSTYGPLAAKARPLYAAADELHGAPEVQWATDVGFRCGTVMQLTQHAATGQPVFAYEFARLVTPEIQPGGNLHGVDNGYVFGTFATRGQGNKLPSIAFTTGDAALSEGMQRYWVNFVRTGNPNGPGLPPWPTFSSSARQYLEFSEAGTVARSNLRRAQCDVYVENEERLRTLR
jgi:para-nitrobenzyl esterase